MGKECGMLKKEEKFTRCWWGKHLENPCVDARMIMNFKENRWDCRDWIHLTPGRDKR
jgi:hypothetical protein